MDLSYDLFSLAYKVLSSGVISNDTLNCVRIHEFLKDFFGLSFDLTRSLEFDSMRARASDGHYAQAQPHG